MLKRFLFFSKYDGENLNEKIDKILENQEKLQNEIKKLNTSFLESQKNIFENIITTKEDITEKQKYLIQEIKEIKKEVSKNNKNSLEITEKYNTLFLKQKEDNENIYGVIKQLLLKDLLETYGNSINEILDNDK